MRQRVSKFFAIFAMGEDGCDIACKFVTERCQKQESIAYRISFEQPLAIKGLEGREHAQLPMSIEQIFG